MKNIDVHCHLFDRRIASWRMLLDILHNITTDDPHIMKDLASDERKQKQAQFDLHGKFDLLFLLLKKCKNDRMYNYLLSFEPDTIMVPLMFDLRFASCEDVLATTLKDLPKQIKDQLNHLYRDAHIKDKFEIFLFTLLIKYFGYRIFNQQGDTFDDQYAQLIELKQMHPDNVMPFIAVDPRRADIFNKMKSAILNDHFAGVKLYCPNGYSPLDPRLKDVYNFCIDHSIPVTAHCSYGGVATAENDIDIHGGYCRDGRVIEYNGPLNFRTKITDAGGVEERAYALNHPVLWNEVLTQYNGLRLNLAHMGVRSGRGRDETETFEWTKKIADMMSIYENLYTDLSCRTDRDQLSNLWTIANNADVNCMLDLRVTDRIMFGTDFWLCLLSDDLHGHLRTINSFFSETDLQRIKRTNPARFLGI